MKKKNNEKNNEALEPEQYRKYVQERLKDLRPVFAKIAIEDLSQDLTLPDVDPEDDFSELYSGIETIVEILRDQTNSRNELERRLDTKMREHAFLLERSQDLAHIGSWELDPDTKGMRWSKELYRIFGVSAENLTPSFDVYIARTHPEDRDLVKEHFSTALREDRPMSSFKHRIVCPKNIERTVQTTIEVICGSDKKKRVCGATQDITDIETTQKNIKILSTVVEQTPDIIFITNRNGEFLYVNKSFERLTGYSLHDVLGKTPQLLRSGRHGQHFYDRFWRTILSGRVFFGEFMNRKRSGEVYYEKKCVAPLFDQYGNITHFVSTGQDVTFQKGAQEALERSYKKLEQTVKERTRELRASNESLQRELTARDNFIALLSHELRNPLAPVHTSLELLRLQGGQDPKTEKLLEVVMRQVQNIGRLLDDLLDVSRITRGKIRLRNDLVNIATTVGQVAETMRPSANEAGHELTVVTPNKELWIEGDPLRIEQIISNLLNNAIKYTPRGGRIELICKKEEQSAVLIVRDTGIGIRADVLPRVFDLFEQPHSTLDRAEGGLGIGLTLVKTLVGMHAGTVTAKSAGVGKGSEFKVHLPLTTKKELPLQKKDPCPVRRHGKERAFGAHVVIVEDNVDLANALSTLFSMIGCTSTVFHNGEEALHNLSQCSPDIIFMDIGLPGLTGYELARKIRGKGYAHLPIVALSGYGQAQDMQRSKDAGIDLHLVKPVGLSKIEEVLALFLQTRKEKHG